MIVNSCAWMQGTQTTSKKKEKIRVDTIILEDGSIRTAHIFPTDDYMMLETMHPDGYLSINLIPREIIDPAIFIAPNPTSSSVEITFFNGYEGLFPQDISLELYYLDTKIHTLEFKQSQGKETISAIYLEKEGVYRVVANMSIPESIKRNVNSQYMATFMVIKGK